MPVPKVLGIETEYGVTTRGGDGNPIAASSILVNAYAAEADRRTGWDFEDESPGNDARGFAREDAMPPVVETHLANTVLTNGARFYVDHAHPEYSCPECADPLELLRHDKAGEEVLRRAMLAARALVPDGPQVVVYKNNSDGKGNSYGCHENYLMDRAVPFSKVVTGIVPHLVTRQVFAGSGKVGTETPALDAAEVPYQISQRAEFFEEVVGLETTLKRPIVNTRDEPHADPRRFRRLHVIIGDANLSEIAIFLKTGTTALVLGMVEDDVAPARELMLEDPVRALHHVSADLSLRRPLRLADGSTITALDIQWELYAAAERYGKERGAELFGDHAASGSAPAAGGAEGGPGHRAVDHGGVVPAILERWEAVLHGLEGDPADLARQLDWVAKLQLVEAYRERHGCGWDDDRLAALDLQYHDLRPERSLYARLSMEKLIDPVEVMVAVTEPPEDTRAYFRGKCLERWPDSVVTANWDSLVFDLGTDPLRRVPMMDPLKGTAGHTRELLETSASPAELLQRLSS